MSGLNKVMLIGRLGQDPDVRYTQSGDCVANLSLATSEKYKDKDGQPQESTEWHRVVLFKRQAELADEYLRKGSQVYIEGKIQTRKWQDNEGNDRYSTEVRGFQMQFLDSRGDSQGQQQPAQQPAPAGGDFDDDIPFMPLGKGDFA